MKRFTKICLILGAALVLLGIGVSLAGYASGSLTGGLRPDRSGSATSERLDIPAEGLSALALNLSSEDVTVLPSPDGALHIEYAVTKDRTYEHGEKGGAYCFASSDAGFGLFRFHFGFWDDDVPPVQIYLPKDFGLSVETASGDVLLQNIQVKTMVISTVSGDSDVSNFSADTLSVSSTSGEIEATGGAVEGSASFSAVSGDLELSNLTISQALSCSTTSGEIDLTGSEITSESETSMFSSVSGDILLSNTTVQGGLSFSTTSGEVQLNPAAVYGDIEANTTSGDIYVRLVEAPAHRIGSVNSSSGNEDISGVSDSGDAAISVDTTSGEIYIRDTRS